MAKARAARGWQGSDCIVTVIVHALSWADYPLTSTAQQ